MNGEYDALPPHSAKFNSERDNPAEKAVSDIVDITCMIVADGEEAKFIHKSVQEYHAALFIKTQPDESAKAFYSAMRTRWETWAQELRFLETIDRYRFLKFFHISELENLLAVVAVKSDISELSLEGVLKFCGGDGVMLQSEAPTRIFGYSVGSSSRYWPTAPARVHFSKHYLFRLDQRKFVDSATLNSIAPNSQGHRTFRIDRLVQSDSGKKMVMEACTEFFRALLTELREAREFVARVEQMKAVFNFDAPSSR